jgi:transcriptional regulator with XRE-family HTH domain
MSSKKYEFYRILKKMGFRENLKSQLEYSNMLVKELAAQSGVKKKTIDSYLGNHGYTPSVDAAVSIAKVLGVSVEYLVTGADNGKDRPLSSFHRDIQEIMLVAERLDKKDRSIILNLARLMRDR